MSSSDNLESDQTTLSATTLDIAIRFAFIALIGYWSFRVIAPFVTIGLWSTVLAVALYPLFDWLAKRLGPRLASCAVTLASLILVIGPVTWLGLGMISGVRILATGLEAGHPAIPLPPESIKSWPIFGERVYGFWSYAANNVMLVLAEAAPMLKPFASKLLDIAQTAFFSLAEILAAIIVSGFLFSRGPQLVDGLSAFIGRILSHRDKELVQLAGATIRSVSRGVVGISILQALLAGAGFLAAGIPVPGVLAFATLLLGIVQIGAGIVLIPIVVWSWTAMETTHALVFTAYMFPVALLDNILKPLLVARGLTTPMPVIMLGVVGGTIAYGIVGLFLGPIVLGVAWAVLLAWLKGDRATPG